MTLSTDWELGEWVYHWSLNDEWERGRIIRMVYDADGWELELTRGYGSWLVDAERCHREIPSEVDLEC